MHADGGLPPTGPGSGGGGGGGGGGGDNDGGGGFGQRTTQAVAAANKANFPGLWYASIVLGGIAGLLYNKVRDFIKDCIKDCIKEAQQGPKSCKHCGGRIRD
ncbi:hypothetical protein D9Q98_008516 [Chlorella vulgaris]|uniref:Uncharacterized protein n=1 Tax=Chlorella vulgaris TaxID=3077 RepID=A0A9D4YUA9_CHLVU|nr:hypothetical protein D9Q98_008516 [Chlorella vulgaris]